MAKSITYRKFGEDNPNYKAIRRYEQEIASLEEKRDKAFDAHDWSMRNFYDAQIRAKRFNMQALKDKFKKDKYIMP